MDKYSQSQIDAVRKRQQLSGIQGYISDANCVKFLDWYMETQSAQANAITSTNLAKQHGLTNGKRKLQEEINMLKFLADC